MNWLSNLTGGFRRLQTLQTRFELVNSASNDGLWDMSVIAGDPINPKNEFWWSDQFRKLLGYKDEKDFPNVLNSWASLLHADDKDWVLKAFGAHLTDYTGRTPYDVEYQLLTKNQGYRWYRARGCTMRDAKGMPLRVAGSLTDITEEKQRLLEMQTLQTRFELVNSASSDGLWDLSVIAGDPVNPKNEFWWSDQFRKMLGYNDERDFPNVLDSWASLLHADDKDRVLKAFVAHLTDHSGRTPYDVEYQLKTKSQGYRWYRARGCTMRDSKGLPLRVAGSLTDITIEKRRIQQAQSLAETAAAASMQFSASAENISQGARNQTEQTRRNAEQIDEMVRSLKATSQSAAQAAQTANNAGTTAEHGGAVVGKTIHGMNTIADVVSDAAVKVSELGASSKRVGEIVGVISSIAEQTNLLALNAAIEAARAGDEGRGFAVVADEVRKLAEHTARSTKEIASVISKIQQDTLEALNSIQQGKTEVDKGKELARQAEVALTQIIGAAKEVDTIIAGVAAASQHQLETSEELAAATETINEITRSNEASIGEMVDGSSSIDRIIHELLSSLTMDHQESQHAAPAPAGRPKLRIV
jgi:PAS domain-containing protein